MTCCGAVVLVRFAANFGPKILKRSILRRAPNFWCGTHGYPRFLRPNSFATTLRGPERLCRASACCGAVDFVRFAADFGPKISKILRGRKILRSKSHEIAPKSVPAIDVQHRQDRQRCLKALSSYGMLRRGCFGAIRGEFRTENFEI